MSSVSGIFVQGLLLQLIPIIVIVLIACFILSGFFRKYIKFESEKTLLLQKRTEELNERLTKIEKLLKEVE